MRAVWLGRDEAAASWIGSQLGIVMGTPGTWFEVLGMLEPNAAGDLDLRGGFVLTGKSACNVDVTVFGSGSLVISAMRKLAHRVFFEHGCERATARCRRSNVEMRSYMHRMKDTIGWSYEGCQRRYWGPTPFDDAMIYGLIPSDCSKWLRQPKRH